MSTPTAINLKDRLEDLFAYILGGRILDAINEFYAENAAMQETINHRRWGEKPIWIGRNNFSTRGKSGNGSMLRPRASATT